MNDAARPLNLDDEVELPLDGLLQTPALRERLLDLDPDLLGTVPPNDFAAVRQRVTVPCITVERGPWDPARVADGAYFGIFVVSGQSTASVQVGPRRHHELVGPGDVGQPWVAGDAGASLPTRARWTALTETRLALLDRRFAIEAAHWPVVTRALMERLVLRSRRLLFQLAVLSLPHVATRVELLLWHFADRWGRATRDGVVLLLPLTHETLSEIVGARRPTVTTALRGLREQGRVEQCSDGCWVLRGGVPAELTPLYAQVGLAQHPPAEAEPA